jgi:N-acetylglucosamine-6-sulfatase
VTGTISRRGLLHSTLAPELRRPNVVFILVDDLRWDELGAAGHPFASTPHADSLARDGALFTNAFSVAPLCSPSRGCFLTGLYPHAHGITDNTDRSPRSHQLLTWPRLLHDSGYRTAFIGKWHMGNDDSPRPGFDTWVSFRGQGDCNNPDLNINGKPASSQGYITDILTEHAVRFLEQPSGKPFCLYLAHKAIHPNTTQRNDGSVIGDASGAAAFIPAPRHRNLYLGRSIPRRPSYGRPPQGKPALQRKIGNLPPLGRDTVTTDQVILNRMRMMKAVDESLGNILSVLSRAGRLTQTMVVLTSDHGYFYGEHGLSAERRLAYEECIRIPLLIRYPPAIRAGLRVPQFALSIDLAPTILEAAGVRPPAARQHAFHGRTLSPLFDQNPAGWREDFLIEYNSDTVFPRIRDMGYRAVRGPSWKYIRYEHLRGMDELYDLRRDPNEVNNLISDPASRNFAATAAKRLNDLLRQTGA